MKCIDFVITCVFCSVVIIVSTGTSDQQKTRNQFEMIILSQSRGDYRIPKFYMEIKLILKNKNSQDQQKKHWPLFIPNFSSSTVCVYLCMCDLKSHWGWKIATITSTFI